jgi:hypothetical protein
MGRKHKLIAQLSTVHSKDDQLEPERVLNRLEETVRIVSLDILAMGWKERTELFEMLTGASRVCREVFLWYPLLSDYPGFDPSHLVVNYRSERSRGWGGYGGTGIEESFKQACPNNPEALRLAWGNLERLLSHYDFDGVFLDKIRFPSMANGLQDVLTCFCPFCREKATSVGLDLFEVQAALEEGGRSGKGAGTAAIPPGAEWLEELLAGQPLLLQHIRFRARSISRIVADVSKRVQAMGKKVAVDVFSPSLAALVGQDLPFMAGLAEWVKPMIYRFGNGPACLRSEIPALIRELAGFLGIEVDEALRWAAAHIEGLSGCSLRQIETAAPLSLIGAEARKAVRLVSGTPLCMGLETVSMPGVMEVSPRHVEEAIEVGIGAGVGGFVLSWDLLHTPLQNIQPLQSL